MIIQLTEINHQGIVVCSTSLYKDLMIAKHACID